MENSGEMREGGAPLLPPADLPGRWLFRLAFGLAIAGGALMVALIAMVVASILGRGLFSAPISGDFELVAMGTGIAVSLALPYCHINRGNVIVDLFLARAPLAVRVGCDVLGSLLLAVLAAVLAWRTVLGATDMIAYREVTIILAIPVWWAFPFVILSLGLLAVCALYTAWRDARGLLA
jgi:TRAP-type C4-dicarboxylate transport system permease small subunit